MFRKLFVAMAAVVAASSVQALDFKVLADRGADFKKISTYKIDDVQVIRASGAKVRQSNIDNLRAAVDQKLQEEGLTKDESNPDIHVAVIAGVDAGHQPGNTQVEPYFDGQWRILPKPGGEEAPEQPMTYNQATLRIDIKDAKTGQ